MTPEQTARLTIDNLLTAAGWIIQNRDAMNLFAGPGVAVREAHLRTGYADYLLFVDGKALGVVEAKAEGTTLSGVESQSARYGVGLQPHMRAWLPDTPLPFRYESTGVETFFTSTLDPIPRSRQLFAFHTPQTLAAWVQEDAPLRQRLQDLPARDREQALLDETLAYTPTDLGRTMINESQIRLVLRTFRERLFTELFPERRGDIVPKTLIFARDDNHAEEIVRIARQVFDEGNDFCQKITYKATRNPDEILADFRNSYFPRIAVTVDMIATGTDVQAIEVLIFLRLVKSLNYFEQMWGRGTRSFQWTSCSR